MPPSKHPEGQHYKWVDSKTPIQIFPPELIKRIKALKNTRTELYSIISKCRPYLRDTWKQRLDIHDEKTVLAIASELKYNGAELRHFDLFCRLMLGNHYSKNKTAKKWTYVKPLLWQNGTLKETLLPDIAILVKPEPVTIAHNPQHIDYNIANRANYYKKNLYVKEHKNGNVIFIDKLTHKKVCTLRYDSSICKYFDDNYGNEGIIKEVNENNSAYFAMYLESLKEIGIPCGGWVKESEFCSTRVYKRMSFNPMSNGWSVEMCLVCRTKNDNGKWIIHEPIVLSMAV